jgi:hypothetical protein
MNGDHRPIQACIATIILAGGMAVRTPEVPRAIQATPTITRRHDRHDALGDAEGPEQHVVEQRVQNVVPMQGVAVATSVAVGMLTDASKPANDDPPASQDGPERDQLSTPPLIMPFRHAADWSSWGVQEDPLRRYLAALEQPRNNALLATVEHPSEPDRAA